MAKEKQGEDENWQDGTTYGDLDGEWVTDIVPGLTVTGKLERAFLTDGEYGMQPAYAIRGQRKQGDSIIDGVHLIGEKASFKEAMRELTLGSSVQLSFTEKKAIVDKKGKKKGDMWLTKLRFVPNKEGKPVREVLKQSHEDMKLRASGDSPF